MSIQHTKDALVAPITKRLPSWVTPNGITVVRLALTIPAFMLFWQNHYGAGLTVFLVVFFTDLIDGALARSRGQITTFGKIVDPIADKVLFLPIFFIVGIDLLSPTLVWTMLIAESLNILNVAVAAIAKKAGVFHYVRQANIFGKTKTFLQVGGFALLILLPDSAAIVAVVILWAATVSAVISFATHFVDSCRTAIAARRSTPSAPESS